MNIIPDPRVLIVQAGGFILLLIVFKLFLFKPIFEILDARRREIESQFESAEAERKVADEMRSRYEQRLLGVEEEIRGKISEAVKEGQVMREEILSDSRAKADSILTKAQEEIHRERDLAMQELKATVVNLAVEAAGKIIDENLDNKKQRKLVDDFINELDEVSK